MFEVLGVLVVAVPVVLGLALLGVMWRAWWLYPAWGWFLVPLGLPPITFWHFTALVVLIDAMKTVEVKKDERKMEWPLVVIGLLWPMVAWVMMRGMR